MKAFSLIAVVLLLAGAVAGISSDDETVNFQVTEVSDLVVVTNNINPQEVLPGHEYAYDLNVKWNVSNVALANINEDKVVLYVKIEPTTNRSAAYFKDENGANVNKAYTHLLCTVENKTCTVNTSVLSRLVKVYYKVPLNESFSNDGLEVYASFQPFAQNQQIVSEAQGWLNDAQNSLDTAFQKGMNVTNEEVLLGVALGKFNDGEFDTSINLSKQIVRSISSIINSTGAPPGEQAQTGGEVFQNILGKSVNSDNLLILIALGVIMAVSAAYFTMRIGKNSGNLRQLKPSKRARMEISEEDMSRDPELLHKDGLVGAEEDIELHKL